MIEVNYIIGLTLSATLTHMPSQTVPILIAGYNCAEYCKVIAMYRFCLLVVSMALHCPPYQMEFSLLLQEAGLFLQ